MPLTSINFAGIAPADASAAPSSTVKNDAAALRRLSNKGSEKATRAQPLSPARLCACHGSVAATLAQKKIGGAEAPPIHSELRLRAGYLCASAMAPGPWQVLQVSPMPSAVLVAKCALAAVVMWQEPQAAVLGPWRTVVVGVKAPAVATSDG